MSKLPPPTVSIIRHWAQCLPLRHQGTLIVATRGCDGAVKENSAKPLTRAIRHAFMNCADPREVGRQSAFMQNGFSEKELQGLLSSWDNYPMHFLQHIMHASQIIGYKHPDPEIKAIFNNAYLRMVKKLHLRPESEDDMDDRLNEDRIALYNSANPPE